MKGNRAVLTAIVLLVLIAAGWWLFGRAGTEQAVDLIALFPQAKLEPAGSRVSVADATLNGETKKTISAEGPARITYRVRVPNDGWLRMDIGMPPDVWEAEGEGAYLFVGVSDNRTFEVLFSQHVHPFANKADRKWMPAFVDLSAYAGDEVDLIFNVRAGAGGKSDNFANVKALWGDPEIVVR